jgi:peptidoglycan/xylan/chitin deacetylase (PgdA/CDA1 family)
VQRRTVAILGFHKIGAPPAGTWPTWYYVPEATFVGYLDYLRQHGWQVLDLAAFLRGLTVPNSLPERAALLTFDDGYRSLRHVALPVLRAFRYPAVLFVPSDFIGKTNAFDEGTEPEEAICDWDDLRDLERQGVAIQSHGASHRALSQLAPAEREEELLRSRAVLEAGLDKAVEVFSFPYGDCGPDGWAVRQALRRAGYRAACLYGGGPVGLPGADPYQLARVAIGPDSDLATELHQR